MIRIGEIGMPSTYAHYRMGQDVLKRLSGGEKTTVLNYKELYDIGLHGPDILFYYKPLFSCPVNKQGYDMHARKGGEFFERAATELRKLNGNDNEAALAYIYGFCCHFALDVSCHRFIDEKIEKSGVTHTEIEVEFDRSLMIKDGYDPLTHILTDHIYPTSKNANIIRIFYDGLSEEDVKKALKGMISYNKLLIAPSHVKRALIYMLLGITGNYKEMHGLLVNFKENPKC
ncbi:MAG: zinc dependent phospholipase C family protein, partial [Lachnospira sp.]